MATTDLSERQEAIQHLHTKLHELVVDGTFSTPRGKEIREAIQRKFEAWRAPGKRIGE